MKTLRASFQSFPIILLVLWCPAAALHLHAQSIESVLGSSSIVPESGFLSPGQYTNAFFGFSLPLPADAVLNEKTLSLNRGIREHLIIGFHSPSRELVGFTITATEVGPGSEKDAKKSTAFADLSKPKEVQIGGKRFWTSESPQTKARALRTAVFTTAIDRYVLEFKIVSFNPDIAAELKLNITRLSFFDPSASRSVAGPESKPYIPGASPFATSRIGQLSAGSVRGTFYQNEDLKIRYEFPHDWVLMSKAAGKDFSPAGNQFLLGNSPAVQMEHEAVNQCAKQLLFVRRFLDNPSTGQFNPMVSLIAADPKCVSPSRFPKSIEDHDSVQRIARDTAAYFRTADSIPLDPARVRAFNNANRVMIDVSRSYSLPVPGEPAPLTVFSSRLIMEMGDYWVIWIFAAGDKAELEELRTTKVFVDDFAAPPDKAENP